jgi:flagellar biosynthesis/type III secretory pathway chaperone
MINPAHAQQHWMLGLQSHVEAITLSLQAMMVLLVREHEALVGRSDARSLDSIAQDKQTAVAQMSAMYEMLRDCVAAHLGPDATMNDGILALREHSPSIARQIENLVQLTRKCQQANHDNGILVSAGLSDTQRAMETLTQVGATNTPTNTYGPAAAQYALGNTSQFTARA